MTTARIEVPPKLRRVFTGAARYRAAYGGRGSGKTRTFALMSAVHGYRCGMSGQEGVILCAREHLNSLDESSMEEVKAAIRAVPWLAAYYEIGDRFIRSTDGRIRYAFAGLRVNLASVKSKSKLLLAWVDEAETVSESAWRTLLPTVREDDSEVWITWNPESSESATHKRFRDTPPDGIKIAEMNWIDNPWFPAVLEQERTQDMVRRADTYQHIWEGGFLSITDAQVFKDRYDVAEFEPGDGWDGPYYGVDFGFAQDPTTAVEVWLHNGRVHIRREAGKVGLELDDTAPFLIDRLPGIERHTSRADSARPESISYLSRHGLPRITGVKKGAGSVEDGVSWIKSAGMTIHPDCPMSAREARLYSHKVDRLSGDILPAIVDDHNHFIDSIRYALQPLIRARSAPRLRRL
jgi:phage terminase large subunit